MTAVGLSLSTFGSISASNFVPTDLAGCVLWLRADLGVTYVQGPVVASGTTPPSVTLTGTPSSSTNSIEIDMTSPGILGVALFSWKLNGVVQQTLQLTSASFLLAGTGITASFASGTYSANNVYTSVVTVSAWADQSGLGHNVSQATSARQPAFTASDLGYGGQSTLLFTKSVPTFLNGASAWSPTVLQPLTILGVFDSDDNGATTEIAYGSAGSLVRLGCVATPGFFANAGTTISAAKTTSNPSVVAFVANGGSSAIYANNSQSPIVSGNAGTNGITDAIYIGAGGSGGGSQGLQGRLPEIIVYSRALAASEMKLAFAYAAARYALSGIS